MLKPTNTKPLTTAPAFDEALAVLTPEARALFLAALEGVKLDPGAVEKRPKVVTK